MIQEPTTFEEAVAFEEENRRLAYLRLGRPLLGLPTGALTWRSVIELSLLNNAFFSTAEPTRHDVFQFLWRVHAYYTQPGGRNTNLPSSASKPSWLDRRLASYHCHLAAIQTAPNHQEMPIRQWVDLAYQDSPSVKRPGEFVSLFAPRLFWYDAIVQFFLEKGITSDVVLDMPVALTFQMLRMHYIAIGDEFRCMPPSTRFRKFQPEDSSP